MNANENKALLDEQTMRLVAIGAAGAVNCRPCLEHHVPLGIAAGLSEPAIREAIEIGFGVNRGAHAKTRKFIDDVISGSESMDNGAECCDEETSLQTGCC